jgi:hypothetical protein
MFDECNVCQSDEDFSFGVDSKAGGPRYHSPLKLLLWERDETHMHRFIAAYSLDL